MFNKDVIKMEQWLVWLITVILLALIEILTINLATIWFVASGIIALGISLITDNYFIQFGTFRELLENENARKIIGANTLPIISGIQSFLGRKDKTMGGFHNGKGIEEIYNVMAKQKGIETIDQIKMPLVIPSVDIMESKEYVFTNYIPEKPEDESQYITDITIGKAVRASSSFPAVFNPCHIKSHAFMDGGTLDNVPVNEVRKQGADKVLAVKFDSDPIDQNSNIMDIVMKTIDIMGSKIAEENLEQSDYILNVCTDKVGLLDTAKLDKCFDYGYEAVIKNLDEIKQILK